MALFLIPFAGLLFLLTLMLGEQAFSRARTFLNWFLWSEDPLPPLPDGPVMFAVFWESLGPLLSVANFALLSDNLSSHLPPPFDSFGAGLAIAVATPLPVYVLLLGFLFDLPYSRALPLQICVMTAIPLAIVIVCGIFLGIFALVSSIVSLLGIMPA